MVDITEHDPHDPGYDVERYFDLAARGVFAEEDHVELLEGLIVASPPHAPLHAGVLARTDRLLQRSLGDRAAVRERTVEVFRYPDPERRLYASKQIATRDDEIRLAALPDVTVRVAELVPGY